MRNVLISVATCTCPPKRLQVITSRATTVARDVSAVLVFPARHFLVITSESLADLWLLPRHNTVGPFSEILLAISIRSDLFGSSHDKTAPFNDFPPTSTQGASEAVKSFNVRYVS